jgi:3-oxoacyl-[acyl-carrier-protein] synthase-3
MQVNIKGLSLKAISTILPKKKLDFAKLYNLFGETEVKRIVDSTGISSVRIAENSVKTSDLCARAAENLFSTLNINKAEIDAVVFVSQTPDFVMPATSAHLQEKLRLKNNIVAFDINYGCSGYVYGLYQAAILIASGGCKKVLLLAGDTITNFLNPKDHKVRLVLGDAGSASLIEKGDDEFSFILKTDGGGSDFLKIENSQSYLFMNGAEVMSFALREVPKVVEELLIFKQWRKEEVDNYIMHQANTFMLNYLRKKLRLAKSIMPIAVENVGNTGPTSIPLTLTLTANGVNPDFKKVVLCGFGAGLSWAAVGLDLSNTIILPVAEF